MWDELPTFWLFYCENMTQMSVSFPSNWALFFVTVMENSMAFVVGENMELGAGSGLREMAESVKGLCCKHGDLVLTVECLQSKPCGSRYR